MRYSDRCSALLALTLIILAVILLPTPLFAQTVQKSDTCNQPMPDPITHFTIAGYPTDPVSTSDGCWILLSVRRDADGSGVAVLERRAGKLELVRFVPIRGVPFGMVLTHDEKMLVVAADEHVALLDVGKLISGQSDAFLGSIRDSSFAGANMVNVTSDGRYLFISQERKHQGS
jgi:hypothetical protein